MSGQPGPSRPRHPSTKKLLAPNGPTVMEYIDKLHRIKSMKMFPDSWLHKRELGMKNKLGSQNEIKKSLYSALTPIAKWGDMKQTGGIFNLEFSEDGSLLVAACEKKCVYMFDPLSKGVIGSIPEAHNDCVNYVRFLDSRVFATCSDDTTIALWDVRNLKSKIRTLQGHSNWVKNIEFSVKDDLLVTAGFDGSIYTWDINNYTETGFVYDRVFQTNGLMRMRLTPDSSKMVICTTAGYLILIHDLDLSTLARDLMGFRPNMYRLMQLSDTALPMATEYHHLFSKGRKRNRVEFITDFPFGDEAEVVSSLQIHPYGWCALSRNISSSERSEWTCVHDIQEYPELDEDEMDVKTGSHPSGTSYGASSGLGSVTSSQLMTTTENRYPQLEISTSDIWEALLVLREARSNHQSASRNVSLQENEQSLRIIRLSSGLQHQVTTSTDDDWETESTSGHNSEPDMDRSADRDPLSMSDDDIPSPEEEPPLSLDSSINPSESMSTDRGEAVVDVSRESSTTTATGASTDERMPLDGGNSVANRTVRRHVMFRLLPHGLRSLEPVVVVSSSADRSTSTQTTTSSSTNTGSSSSTTSSSQISGRHARRFQRFTNTTTNTSSSSSPPPPGGNKLMSSKSYVQNKARLTHYVEELNVGKGYIKELCFSSDGRLVCSPFSFGVRLFSFNEDCAHLSACVPHNGSHVPSKLFELSATACHSDIVLSSKFSPKHDILVSGCLNGRIVLYQPVF